MNALRRHRLRARVSLLAISALLWSQMLLALHAGCLLPPAQVHPAAAVVEHEDCAETGAATELVVCASHCSRGEASSDASRVPPVPLLAPMLAPLMVEVLDLRPAGETGLPRRAHVRRHGPTLHPASVLLI